MLNKRAIGVMSITMNITMNITLTCLSIASVQYPNHLQWRIVSDDHLAITLSVNFLVRSICWLNNNTRPPALCAGEASDEKLKINELGPNLGVDLKRMQIKSFEWACVELDALRN